MRYFKLIMILLMTFNVRPCISKHSGIKYYLDNFSLCCLPCFQNKKYCRVFRHKMNRLINTKMKEEEKKKEEGHNFPCIYFRFMEQRRISYLFWNDFFEIAYLRLFRLLKNNKIFSFFSLSLFFVYMQWKKYRNIILIECHILIRDFAKFALWRFKVSNVTLNRVSQKRIARATAQFVTRF